MEVKLSQSAQKLLKYLSNDLKLENFEEVVPTIEFTKVFNNLFES